MLEWNLNLNLQQRRRQFNLLALISEGNLITVIPSSSPRFGLRQLQPTTTSSRNTIDREPPPPPTIPMCRREAAKQAGRQAGKWQSQLLLQPLLFFLPSSLLAHSATVAPLGGHEHEPGSQWRLDPIAGKEMRGDSSVEEEITRGGAKQTCAH